MSDVVVQYVAGCPNLPVVIDRLREAGAEEQAVQLVEFREHGPAPDGFAGSPTVLIDGINPLGPSEPQTSTSCTLRLPSVEQLRNALDR